MATEYFCCYNIYLKACEGLSDSEVGRLFRALLEYSTSGTKQELNGRESVAFGFIAADIDRDRQLMNTASDVEAKNGGKGKAKPETPKPSGRLRGELGKALDLWLKYKSEKGQPYKKTGLDVLEGKFERAAQEYGESAVCEIVKDSIGNGYQGIVWDKLISLPRASTVSTYSYRELE